MDKDVFFLSHGNQENGGGDDSVSKHNSYEVNASLSWTQCRANQLVEGRDDQGSRKISASVWCIFQS